jgi:hypothetical protein
MRGQSGQALALVLVVMAILFALAGALTIGVTELLQQQGGGRAASTDDLTVQSAVADGVAFVAGRQNQCAVTPATMARSSANQPASQVRINFPNGAGHASPWPSGNALCSRLDHVASSLTASTFSSIDPKWGTAGGCDVVKVPNGNPMSWVAFNGRWQASGYAYAYVDGQSASPCNNNLAPPRPGSCSSTPKPSDCIRCGQNIVGPVPPVVQLALECDTSGSAPLYLHIHNTLAIAPGPGQPANTGSPARIFFAPESTSGTGVLYVLAAPTSLKTPSDYEESLLYVGPGGSPNQLVYEAPLP